MSTVREVVAKIGVDTTAFTQDTLRAERSAASLTKSLEKQAATFGLPTREAKITGLALRGASEETLKAARAANEHVVKLEQQKRAMNEAAAITDAARSPFQRLETEVQKLDGHLKAGRITQETYNAAVTDTARKLGVLVEVESKAERAAREHARAVKEQQAVQQRAARVIESVRTPLQNYRREVANLDDLLKRGAINQSTYSRAMRQTTTAYRSNRAAALSAAIANSTFGRSISGLLGGLSRLGTMLIRNVRRFALLGAGAVAALGTAAIVKFEGFNRAMRQSQAIMGDLTDVQMRRMSEAAIATARVTRFSGEDAAKSYFFLASAGLDAEQSIAALPQVAQFAQAGMFDMALATDLLTDAQSALGLTVPDVAQNLQNMARVSDVLVKANTLANASVQQFSEALTNKAGAALKVTNKSLEEGIAVLAAFADQGIKGAEAGNALNIVMRDLQTKAIQNASVFDALGVRVFDAAGNMNNMADIVGDMERALAGMSTEQQKATLLQLGFSDKSVVFQQVLLGTSEKIRAYEESLRSAGGTTEAVAGRQLTGLQKSLEKVKAEFLRLSAASAPVIAGIASGLETLAKRMESVDVADLTKRVKHAFGSMVVFARNLYDEVLGIVTKFSVLKDLVSELLGVLPDSRNALVSQLTEVENKIAELERFKQQGIGIRFDSDVRNWFTSTEDQIEELKRKASDIRVQLNTGDLQQRFDVDQAAEEATGTMARNIVQSVGASLGLFRNTASAAAAAQQTAENMADVVAAATAAADSESGIAFILDGLKSQLDGLTTTDLERTVAQLQSLGATEQQINDAKLFLAKIREITEAQKERQSLEQFARGIIEQQITPAERMIDMENKLREALDAKLLTQEQYVMALKKAREEQEKQDAGVGSGRQLTRFDLPSLRRAATDALAAGRGNGLPRPDGGATGDKGPVTVKDQDKVINTLSGIRTDLRSALGALDVA